LPPVTVNKGTAQNSIYLVNLSSFVFYLPNC
jgi:hypothetical protein